MKRSALSEDNDQVTRLVLDPRVCVTCPGEGQAPQIVRVSP